jgi:RNA polymerase sigma-B factor
MVLLYTSVNNELKRESAILLRDYQQSRSATIRNQLVKLNFGLVRKEALLEQSMH